MDMNHQFLHRRLMGRIRAVPLHLRKGDGWVEVDHTFRRTAGKQPLGEWFMIGRRSTAKTQPERDLMTVCTGYPYETLTFRTAGREHPALDLWNVYVPIDAAQRENHTFGLMMVRKPPIPGLIPALWPFIVWFTESIFAEDRFIVEEEQKAFDAQGADWNQEVSPTIGALRQMLIEGGLPIAPAGDGMDADVQTSVEERAVG